ncbi:MAG: hypothetical protein A2042_01005 [Candidatus Schekmanbacteria bacterium GWA2_38_11]|uniref:Uncharacterized protein n=1 Tax=Candidatus Schekmanbacteria bacterium GWA2_38_11 TaxID=1817876 RepID=A0A1F7RB80_9BACT|nr:MAG: hypothetical protein A2042_01005 [Candidatus Schekmanbacteria bacterium GWA2_38_11]
MRKIPIIFVIFFLIAFPIGSRGQDIEKLGITLPPSLNFATSPNPVGSGARAVGMGGAFISIADDATAASWNPGGLIQLEKPEVSVVGAYAFSKQSQAMKDETADISNQTLQRYTLNYLSFAYPFQLFGKNFVASLNSQRLYDLHGRTKVLSLFKNIDGIQEVHSEQEGELRTLTPALAVQINPKFSLGASFNFWDRNFSNWSQNANIKASGFVASGNKILPFKADGVIKEDYDLNGFNTHIGFLWEINRMFTIGGVVKTPFLARVKHHHRSSIETIITDETGKNNNIKSSRDFKETLKMRFPVSYGLGLATRFSDNFSVAVDLYRTEWEYFKLSKGGKKGQVLVEGGAPSGKGKEVLSGKAEATTQVKIGAEYLIMREKFTIPVRSGIFYDPEPAKNNPDDFYGVSFGTGIAWGRIIFDIAYTYRFGKTSGKASTPDIRQHLLLTSMIFHF